MSKHKLLHTFIEFYMNLKTRYLYENDNNIKEKLYKDYLQISKKLFKNVCTHFHTEAELES